MGNREVMIGYNMAVENLQTGLRNAVNGSGLPIAVCYLAVKELLTEMESAKDEAVSREIKDYEKRMKESAKKKPEEGG